MSKPKNGGKGPQFTCPAADAKEVFLAGAFNDWQADATPMALIAGCTKTSRNDSLVFRAELACLFRTKSLVSCGREMARSA